MIIYIFCVVSLVDLVCPFKSAWYILVVVFYAYEVLYLLFSFIVFQKLYILMFEINILFIEF